MFSAILGAAPLPVADLDAPQCGVHTDAIQLNLLFHLYICCKCIVTCCYFDRYAHATIMATLRLAPTIMATHSGSPWNFYGYNYAVTSVYQQAYTTVYYKNCI